MRKYLIAYQRKRPPASRWPFSFALKSLSYVSINKMPIFFSEVVTNDKEEKVFKT
jgi:hypothetical protein